ncbi:MAG TPA: glycosyltransferase [Pedobacter sp.]|nr:glycosyltransferase [Pedobacter sp.]
MEKKISVIIPTYNRPELLIRCLRALAAQTLDKSFFEVIVVTDGPDPETANAVRSWLRHNALDFYQLSTPDKRGPAAARNLGWLSARAPLVAFTDDDCIPDKGWLERFTEQHGRQDTVAYTGYTSVPVSADPTDFALNTKGLENAEFITANCACTKQALLLTGGFDERFKLAWREDSDLHFKLLIQGIPIVKISEARVVHPVRDAKWGISIKEQKKASYEALLFSKYPDLYRRHIASKGIWNYYVINLLCLILIASLIFNLSLFAWTAVALLVILWVTFAIRRLKNTQKSVAHILEMLTTSILIPTLSVYWRLYGAVKYKVIFI